MKTSRKGKQNKGITLIALVITIIVLLILAGVTIATLTGDNGLLTKTTEAKNTNTEAEIEEQIRLAWNDYYISQHTKAEYTFQDAIDNVFGEGKATVTSEGSDFIVVYGNITKKVDTLNGTIMDSEIGKEEEVVVNPFIENTSETEMLMYVKIAKSTDNYYVVGSFNNWNTQDETYKLQKMNIANDNFDYYKTSIPGNSEFKIISIKEGETYNNCQWIPDGVGNNATSYAGTTYFVDLTYNYQSGDNLHMDSPMPDNW